MGATNKGDVLLVEDNEELRALLADILDLQGFTTVEVANGLEAVAYLSDHEAPCVIVLDLRMPLMDGWEFRSWQQQHPALRQIPVIILSADGNGERTCAILKPEAYIEKPIDLDTLLAVIREKTPC